MTDLALAVDIGGTKLEAALVTVEGRLVDGSRHRAPTGRDRSAEELDTSVADVVRAALAALPDGARLVGAGVGSAGPVSLPAGSIAPLNLPQWRDHPIRERVAALSGLPTTVRLDGQCFALAEAWSGSLAGSRNAIAIVVSTGRRQRPDHRRTPRGRTHRQRRAPRTDAAARRRRGRRPRRGERRAHLLGSRNGRVGEKPGLDR